jgi:quinoprotein dehydrogenase-associated probable ABC transporter substrate-binding protein
MSLGCRLIASLAFVSLASAAGLRVCADPDNLPYSNSRQQGFENELARLVGRELGHPIAYHWLPQREKYFKALAAGACDLVMEAPAKYPGIRTTRPYYRSIYVFVSRRDRKLSIRSFDDAQLKTLHIGVQVMGSDDATAPPAEALATRGMMRNVTWYRVYQNYLSANRPEVLIDAVEKGDVDVAIAWGPLAGYFARRARTPLEISPVSPRFERSVPFVFDIAMGVSPGNTELAAQLNGILDRNAVEVRRILEGYGVPLLDLDQSARLPYR